MVSLVIILAVAVIAVFVISGIVWAVRKDSKDEKKEKTMPALVQRQAAEKQGVLKQVGDIGQGVYYTKT
ncbi:MAG: hypothetical protein A2402_04125 [Candidatus Staskawiczbacteria bacterium RIFOXYC1_FULL_37_43]|nr:MAG: hypothetical protein A2813_00405 [Candidatus Staskawiczbacteria bacterium RIFCSPHIGHO2_01_FULL_37_17]OGZ71143.1 MAG: hypothetical protein A2891_01090 [Candidatus Staskawiczbacteria bacterium RIFCSPLOWO2_01_FULL_37_19]OGZ75819.1 MAG: hypothetical protein A2205_03045 [Candidatus Staskawiczbacteria bacterium RIFOXYA1_FULL_37_15]OGZ80709.1 MAG: hypothetical protein A2353_00725 [Candidatus Staskawiczbacteria bacterium RIFOXYB1_FULL_38_37]OGZ82168.1 MAG: hypothetical protein A2325_00495 [Cand